MITTSAKITTKESVIKESINIQIPLVIQWFIESEQCMLGSNAVRIPITKKDEND